jgi:hypothetical protein
MSKVCRHHSRQVPQNVRADKLSEEKGRREPSVQPRAVSTQSYRAKPGTNPPQPVPPSVSARPRRRTKAQRAKNPKSKAWQRTMPRRRPRKRGQRARPRRRGRRAKPSSSETYGRGHHLPRRKNPRRQEARGRRRKAGPLRTRRLENLRGQKLRPEVPEPTEPSQADVKRMGEAIIRHAAKNPSPILEAAKLQAWPCCQKLTAGPCDASGNEGARERRTVGRTARNAGPEECQDRADPGN